MHMKMAAGSEGGGAPAVYVRQDGTSGAMCGLPAAAEYSQYNHAE